MDGDVFDNLPAEFIGGKAGDFGFFHQPAEEFGWNMRGHQLDFSRGVEGNCCK